MVLNVNKSEWGILNYLVILIYLNWCIYNFNDIYVCF